VVRRRLSAEAETAIVVPGAAPRSAQVLTVKLRSNYYTTLSGFKFFRAADFRRVGLIDKLNAKENQLTKACDGADTCGVRGLLCEAYGAKL
jgi:hypothetical protein